MSSSASWPPTIRSRRSRNSAWPAEIQGRPVRACLEDLAAALKRTGSDGLTAELRHVLSVLPDVAGLTHREILERLKGSDREVACAPA